MVVEQQKMGRYPNSLCNQALSCGDIVKKSKVSAASLVYSNLSLDLVQGDRTEESTPALRPLCLTGLPLDPL